MPLYKFIEKQFLDDFFATGSLRLGTIHDYKDTVEHGSNRGDSLEGEHRILRRVEGALTLTRDSHEPILSECFSGCGEGEVIIDNANFAVTRRCPDAFIFCTSHLFNESLFMDWNREEDLDACYEITDVHGFVRAITNAISSSAYFANNANVLYVDDYIDYQSQHAQVSPAFTKYKDDYQWQLENRSVWAAKKPCGPLRPWIVNVPEAIRYCRPYALLEDEEINFTNV